MNEGKKGEMQERINKEKILCWKASSELKLYKFKMLSKSNQAIFDSAFEIDAMLQLYEALIQQIPIMSITCLQNCIERSGLLSYLYQTWLNTPDSQSKEINQMTWKAINYLERSMS